MNHKPEEIVIMDFSKKDYIFPICSNIRSMKQQLEALDCSFDWSREFATCDPSYYKWTQYIFLKMFDKGLVYQKDVSYYSFQLCFQYYELLHHTSCLCYSVIKALFSCTVNVTIFRNV